MRNFIILALLALLAAAPAFAAPKPGQRTQPPARIAPAAVDPEAEMQAAIAAAEAHPLGSLANPVRAAGPEGERAYLARLLCADGKTPAIAALGQGEAGAYGSLVDLYALDCGAAAPGRVQVAMDGYQEENIETRPLAGFTTTR